MSQFYSTGPIPIWVGAGSGGAPAHLGWGKRAPRIRVRRSWGDVFCDLGGIKLPSDKILDGELGLVTVTLIKYNESVLRTIQSVATAGPAQARGVRGLMANLELGSLLIQENLAYGLWLGFPFSSKAVYQQAANGAMPAGYHFLAATLGENDDLEGGLGMAREVSLTWECMRVYSPTDFSWKLYDEDMSGLPLVS